jgi:hypothetical protein
MRDGVSFGKVERVKPLVSIEGLASLPNLECFVKLPDPNCRVARIKMEYQNIPLISKHNAPCKTRENLMEAAVKDF